MHTISGEALRRALRGYPTGVTVVTTRGRAGDHGMTANSFTAVSLNPPLILVCAYARSRGPAMIAANGVFTVNVLSADQEYLSRRFACADRPRGAAAFRRRQASRGSNGLGHPDRRLRVPGLPAVGVASGR